MLKESMHSRPNIYQVLKEGCAMQGREAPIKDVSALNSRPEFELTLMPRFMPDDPNPTLAETIALRPKLPRPIRSRLLVQFSRGPRRNSRRFLISFR